MFALTSSPLTGPPPGTPRCTRHDLGSGIVRIALRGELDLSSRHELDRLLDEALADADFVVFDLDELSFVDPVGAAPLRAAGQRAGSRVIAVNLQPHVRETLMAIGVDRVLKLVPPAPSALIDEQAA